MTTDPHADFLRTIIAAPDDDAPRLVYADWLEENGEPERAEFIRVQCESHRLHAICCKWANAPSNEPGGSAKDGGKAGEALAESQILDDCAIEILERQFARFTAANVTLPSPWELLNLIANKCIVAHEFSRGFLESIHCGWSIWCTYSKGILARTPLRKVELVNIPDFSFQRGDSGKGRIWLDGEIDPVLFDLPESLPGHTQVVNRLLKLRWPNIKFVLPREGQTGQHNGASVGARLPF